jgi:hypothetical protein
MKSKRWRNESPFVQSTFKNYTRALFGPWYGSAILEQNNSKRQWKTLQTRSGTIFADSLPDASRIERDARDLESAPPMRRQPEQPEELSASSSSESHDERDGLIVNVQK